MSDDSISLPTQLQQDSGFIFSEKSGCNNGEQFFCFQLNSFYQFVLFIKMASKAQVVVRMKPEAAQKGRFIIILFMAHYGVFNF